MANLLTRLTNTTTATPAPAPSTDPDSEAMMDPPGWGPPRTVLPSAAANPDELDETSTTAAAAGGSAAPKGEQAASIRALFRERAKSYAKVAEVLFKAVGGLANEAAAVDDSEAWLPDDDDLETVPPPLGRLAARRIKWGADPEQLSDVEDIGMLVVGLVVWGAKGIAGTLEARRARKRLEADKAIHRERGDGQ